MPSTIDQAYVSQFTSDFFHIAQQKKSRLRMAVMNGNQKGEKKFYERIGKAEAQKKLSRHGDTPLMEVEHSRRMVTLEDYEWGKLLDKEDDEKILIDATNAYTQAASAAMGRAMDDEIILALTGNSYSGKNGDTAVPLPSSQKILAANDAAPGTPTKLNVDTLVHIKERFWQSDLEDEEEEFHILVNARQLRAMLRQTEATSADYANIKALVDGKIDTFMGFKFHRSQRVDSETVSYDTDGSIGSGSGSLTADPVIAWAKSGMVLSVAREPIGRVDERADKSYAKQVYAAMGIGAVRLEEEKVVVAYCQQS